MDTGKVNGREDEISNEVGLSGKLFLTYFSLN